MAEKWKSGALIALAAFLLSSCNDALGDRYVSFAQCLKEKGATMYGAYWCPHCATQKAMFGKEGFKNISYTECDPRGPEANPQLCDAKNVQGYPTWEFADGKMTSGVLELPDLSEKTGCPLPPASELPDA